MTKATTSISTFDETSITVRGRDLCRDLIGKIDLVSFIHLTCLGVAPSEAQRAVIEAALVTLAEHGLTPSAVAARLTFMGAPESFQGAVAAGLLGVGDQFVGTVEQVAPLLVEMREHPDGLEAAAAVIVARHRAAKQLLPGFGQPHHKPDDPRPAALFAVGEKFHVNGIHVESLKTLGRHVDKAMGRHMTINAPGAISALLLEIGVPVALMRGLVVISRCIGLVAQVYEESRAPVGRTLWKDAAAGVAFEPTA